MSDICIYSAANVIEAHLVKGLLTGEGIAAYIIGEHLTGALGELPPTEVSVDVYILLRHQSQGQQIIDDYLASQSKTLDDSHEWICRQCGESNAPQFEICWQCHKGSHE